MGSFVIIGADLAPTSQRGDVQPVHAELAAIFAKFLPFKDNAFI